MFSFTPLEILYIVLAFCALWFTAALFWLLWQLANIFKNVNDAVSEVREQIHNIERALTGIREKFDKASSLFGLGANTAVKAVEYILDKKSAIGGSAFGGKKQMMDRMKEEPEPPSRKPAFKKKRK